MKSLALALLLSALLAPGLATAAPSKLVIDSLTPELEQAKSGGGSKLELELTNITDGPAVLTVKAVGQRGCKPTLSKNQLPPNQLSKVEVNIPAGPPCSGGDELALKLTAELAGETAQVFLIDPEGEAPKKPDWKVLVAFPGLLLLSLILAVLFLFKGWTPQNTLHSPKRNRKGLRGGWHRLWDRLRQPLLSIDVSTWKFNDNWGTNVTATGALLTGIFGATTAKAFLGPDAESLTALATVGAAIALIFVTAAPIVVVATKSYALRDGKPGNSFTVGGVLLGAAAVTAAAIGQLLVIAYTATELDIGLLATVAIGIAFVFAVLLLLVYTRRSLKDLLERGTEPPSEDPEVEIQAAKLIAEAIKAASATGTERTEALQNIEATAVAHRSAASATSWRRHPRSALI